jgi:hypothetical protein
VDVTPPTLVVKEPPRDGTLTNRSETTVAGTVSEPGVVTVNGIPVPLTPAGPQTISVVPGHTDPPYLRFGTAPGFSDDFSSPDYSRNWTVHERLGSTEVVQEGVVEQG